MPSSEVPASLVSAPVRAAWARGLAPYACLVVTMLCWAGNWVVGRAIRGDMPPVALNFWRWTLAAALIAPFALPRLKGKAPVLRRHWRPLLGLSTSGIALFQVMVYLGLRHTTTVNAVLMNSAAPLFIILCAWLFDRDRASRRQFAGILVSFLGILVIMERGDLSALRHFRFETGDLIVLAAMPVWGTYAVLLKRRPRELDGIALLFVLSLISLVLLAPFYLAESLWFAQPVLSLASAGAVLYVALFASVLAYFCWNYGVAAVGPSRAGFMLHLLPGFGTVLAILLLGESVAVYHFVGIATILVGVTLATSSRAR